MKRKRIGIILASLFFLWGIIIIILSVIPSNEMIKAANETEKFRLDYLEHFTAFFLFSFLFYHWRKKATDSSLLKRHILLFLLIGSIFAASTELVQIFINSRTFNPVDMLCNLAGVLIGLAPGIIGKSGLQ